MNRLIARLRNGLRLDGRTSNGVLVYLANHLGNALLSAPISITANANGLTTAIIPADASFVTITSSGATQAVSLPAASADTIGKELILYVGANGYELLTEASSNDTINGADADGTNQLDVAANTVLRLVQVSATAWFALQQTATAVSAVAPDND